MQHTGPTSSTGHCSVCRALPTARQATHVQAGRSPGAGVFSKHPQCMFSSVVSAKLQQAATQIDGAIMRILQ